MQKNNLQTTNTQTTTTSTFDQKADKWWESRWAFVMAIAIPLIAVTGVWADLRLADQRQEDAISLDQTEHADLQAQITLFINGDFKDQTQRVVDLTTSVNALTVQVAQLQTIINERIPAK
jgi:hypothetical protein